MQPLNGGPFADAWETPAHRFTRDIPDVQMFSPSIPCLGKGHDLAGPFPGILHTAPSCDLEGQVVCLVCLSSFKSCFSF